VGYSEDDLDSPTNRAFPQKRLIDNGPVSIDPAQMRDLFEKSLSCW
jgi:hypothetical protein